MKLTIRKNNGILKDSENIDLPDLVVITGANGSGKSQLLTALQESQHFFRNENLEKEPFSFLQNDIGEKIMRIESISSFEFNPSGGGLQSKINDRSRFSKLVTIAPFIGNQEALGTDLNDSNTLNQRFRAQFNIPDVGGQQTISDYDLTLIKRISQKSQKDISKLEFHDFVIFEDYIQQGLFSTNLSLLFKQYIYTHNYYPNLNSQTPPWETFNDILNNGDLPYRINYPDLNNPDTVEAYLTHIKNGERVEFEQLSSGEKTIMYLIFALYNSNLKTKDNLNTFPEVLLMDEPDASLHPSLTAYFLKVIREVFIEQNKIKVIMTTHSPSTVALSPESSIFTMVEGVLSQADKNAAIKMLTEGLSTLSILYENRKQVFVEADFDVVFFENLFQVLREYLDKDIILSFMPSGSKSESGCEKVIQYTNLLYDSGNKSISGLIDWDLKDNREAKRIKVFGLYKRYTVENYIFDPIFLSIFLLTEHLILPKEHGFDEAENIFSVINISEDNLQNVVDRIVTKVKSKKVRKMVDNDEPEIITLLNGFKIKLPKWYLISPGHALEETCIKAFPKLNAYTRTSDNLKTQILLKVVRGFYKFLPSEVIEPFKQLQSLPIS
ncbi:ATP-binding protein [Mucilaginibacter sp. 14171R-50]|uniref:ATP-dependent nuclease n=1 Tax=Mucilaginibacter sp. 14171R-50 TaxID=2703789 RepID=UPI00138C012F|nr:ATP-binding protein [Mucilaginibacter sp. 14171R-50]QHS56227.1 ATP-binding protein [Mucilaginibacter sp. 14171R-50]